MGGHSRGVRMQGGRYCRTECMELALVEVLGRAQAAPQSNSPASHRIPLGLLLLSRQQLTAVQRRPALAAQRGAGRAKNQRRKRIGGWLQELRFSSEPHVPA